MVLVQAELVSLEEGQTAVESWEPRIKQCLQYWCLSQSSEASSSCLTVYGHGPLGLHFGPPDSKGGRQDHSVTERGSVLPEQEVVAGHQKVEDAKAVVAGYPSIVSPLMRIQRLQQQLKGRFPPTLDSNRKNCPMSFQKSRWSRIVAVTQT